MTKRTIILHYHLFKNAGTSLDRILKDNFPDQWVTQEFSGRNNTAQVQDWILSQPDAVAFSSHTMMGPVPQIDGVRIVSLIFLRDPIARIRSAYRFERTQESDNFGAVLAKVTDFEGYVRVRLSLPHDRQCRNFQTSRLASMVPGSEPELERATKALKRLSVVGRVEDFSGAMIKLKAALDGFFPEFKFNPVHANRSVAPGSATDRLGDIGTMLIDANQDDLMLADSLNRA